MRDLPIHFCLTAPPRLRRASPWSALLASLLPLAALPGCANGDQFGGESGGGECIVVSRQTIELDEVAPIGFRAEDVLAFAADRFEIPFKLSVSDDDADVAVTPGGDTTLAFEVASSATTATFVDAELEPGSTSALDCLDYLEVETEITLETDNGAFDDTLPATLRAHHAARAQVEVDLHPGSMHGAFDVTGDDLDELVRAPLRLTIRPGHVLGDLGASYRAPGEEKPSRHVSLWQTADDQIRACYEEDFGGPIDDGAPMARLRTLLEETPRLAITFTSGDAHDVELEARFELDGPFCLGNVDVPSLSFSGDLVLTRASDGSPFVTWPVTGYGRYTQDGQFRDLHVSGGRELELPVDEEEAVEAFGDFGFDLSGLEQYGVATLIWLEHDGSGAWQGNLRVEADQDILAEATVTELE